MWRISMLALALLTAGCPSGPTSEPPPPPSPLPDPMPTGAETVATTTAAPTTTSQATTGTPAPTASAPAGGEPWLGDWSSAACGDRKYVRWLTLAAGGNASGEERVSPCPKGVACVWSGIVPVKGSWRAGDGGVTLSLTAAGGHPVTLPTALRWDAGALVEEHGNLQCRYARR